MDYLVLLKSIKVIFLHIMFILVFLLSYKISAGSLVEVDGFKMYQLSNGDYAKSTWGWVDVNGDSVKECYRFDENGHIAKNYVGHDGKMTNDKGQLIENGFVMKKLSSGVVMKGEGTPFVISDVEDSNIINKTDSKTLENIFIDKTDGETVITKKVKDEVVIPIEETEKSNIIYVREETDDIFTVNSDGTMSTDKVLIAGKKFNKYIISKKDVKVDVEKAIIFGNDIWEDVIELRGNNSSIKINTKNFNYLYFEVAEEKHVVDIDDDIVLTLDIYFDGKLYDTLDEFVESNPQVEIIDDLNAKEVEFKVSIKGKNKYRKVYIRNGRLRKIREKNE